MNEVRKIVTNYHIRSRQKRKFLCTFGFKELGKICTGQFRHQVFGTAFVPTAPPDLVVKLEQF
jgi:hypothetical protein